MTAHVSFYVIAILALRLKGHSLQERNVLGNVNIVDHPIQKICKYYTLKPYYYCYCYCYCYCYYYYYYYYCYCYCYYYCYYYYYCYCYCYCYYSVTHIVGVRRGGGGGEKDILKS